MFWTVDLTQREYASEDSARSAAQAIANEEFRPVIVCMGLPGMGYLEVAFTVRAIRS